MNYLGKFYFGQSNKLIVYLKQYLNEILALKPPLALNEKYDEELASALVKFKFAYNLKFPENKIPATRIIDNATWLAIGRMLEQDRLKEELQNLKDETVKKLLQGLPMIVVPPYSEAMATCDKKIAALFGGEDAVVATVYEPKTLASKENAGLYRIEHLADDGVFHIYTNEKGTEAKTGLYAPASFEYLRGGEYTSIASSIENYFRFVCLKGQYRGVEIAFVHVAGSYGGKEGGEFMGKEFVKKTGKKIELIGSKNNAGSVQIGYVGGLGGEGKGYNHTHVNVYYNGKRTDPRKIFCR